MGLSTVEQGTSPRINFLLLQSLLKEDSNVPGVWRPSSWSFTSHFILILLLRDSVFVHLKEMLKLSHLVLLTEQQTVSQQSRTPPDSLYPRPVSEGLFADTPHIHGGIR